jgi:hypothetical protein
MDKKRAFRAVVACRFHPADACSNDILEKTGGDPTGLERATPAASIISADEGGGSILAINGGEQKGNSSRAFRQN